MKETVLTQIAQVEKMSMKELKIKYMELYGTDALPVQNNKSYLFRRVAYMIQEQAFGGLSETAKTRIDELINEQDPLNAIRQKQAKIAANIAKSAEAVTSSRDLRLPLPGTVITKHYKDGIIHVKVLDKGFDYNGKAYKSLSRIACEITGDHVNGFTFFKL